MPLISEATRLSVARVLEKTLVPGAIDIERPTVANSKYGETETFDVVTEGAAARFDALKVEELPDEWQVRGQEFAKVTVYRKEDIEIGDRLKVITTLAYFEVLGIERDQLEVSNVKYVIVARKP